MNGVSRPAHRNYMLSQLIYWITERDLIRTFKENNEPKPWTKDWILRDNRFCNVHREDDSVTKWIAENWRTPNAGDDNLWFNMLIARLLNWPATLGHIGYTKKWHPDAFRRKLAALKLKGEKMFSSAYIVSTNGVSGDKVGYLIESVLTPAWEKRKSIQPVFNDSLESFSKRLRTLNGIEGFMAGQIVADVKYDRLSPLSGAVDWWSWAVSGPGSRRGLWRVMFDDNPASKPNYPDKAWSADLQWLLSEVRLHLPGMDLHAQDLQNCLCEFDKYQRTKLGQGRPKQKYPGAG